MPRPGASLRLALLLVAATVGPPGTYGEQSVGCLYSERLCLENEWCYDDYAFGRCLEATGDVDPDDLYRFNLEREELHELSAELRRLFALGYRWSHEYTQCRLQAMLYATKNDMTFEQNTCTHLVDQDLEAALKALEGQVPLDPQEVAIIKYTPSEDDPHGRFADEIYSPPEGGRHRERAIGRIIQPEAIDMVGMQDPYDLYPKNKRTVDRISIPPQYFNERYNTPTKFRMGEEVRDNLEFLPQFDSRYEPSNNEYVPYSDPESVPYSDPESVPYSDPEDFISLDQMSEIYPIVKYLNDMRLSPREIEKFLTPENYNKLAQLLAQFEEAEAQNTDSKVFKRRMFEDLPESRIYYDENEPLEEVNQDYEARSYNDIPKQRASKIFRELQKQQRQDTIEPPVGQWGQIEPNSGIYTEGGVVYAPQKAEEYVPDEVAWKNNLANQLLEKFGMGFKRPERLDVKKPGPPFDAQITDAVNKAMQNQQHTNTEDNVIIPNMMKKVPRGGNPIPDWHSIKQDNNYVYIGFKNKLESWSQGQWLMGNISKILRLEPTAFIDGDIKGHTASFRVVSNSRGLNATEVAKHIDFNKYRIQEATGVEITATGIGDRQRMNEETHAVLATKMDDQYNNFFMVMFLVCSVLVGLILATLLLLIIKRHVKKWEKLQGLSKPDTEASKDYQDLCRARMAGKQTTAAGDNTVHGRITSLSRESEQSPSSRSSTSSWSEEPALHNMDISTGHMVLNYMEDHLKNKDRLEQEWVALCAYVAEPCEVTIAMKKENVEKNRFKEVVPYDHARVVLNELSNAAGSDYINASSITDHDPRNPAYIATQGPLPNTAPEFWQLIWEQGAVVIVMLTRLTEGGNAMCHRYWPEEGSELYHIYEVHLVSEHIWCDDYLVRSFYLKNVRTGETRTVTQFHFLSWSDGSVPASTKALLEFRRKVNKSYRGRSCPIVVHCSDGAGRTGTYCLIDMVLSRMAKGAKEIDIAATLEHLRDQRPRMVTTKQQFEFVLTAVAEEVHAILKALPPQPNPPSTQEKQ